VVPTRNGATTLPALIDALASQDDAAARELIVVDSGSTDGTLALAGAAADHVIEVAPNRFNHGTSRNLGIERASGRFVVLTVQDARPLTRDWLSHLLAPLRRDAGVAGVFARQVPRPDASAVTRDHLSRWVASQNIPRVMTLDPETFALAEQFAEPEQRFVAVGPVLLAAQCLPIFAALDLEPREGVTTDAQR